MERKNKLIIAIAIVSAIGILAVAWGTFLSGPDLSLGNKNILVLASDKDEQPGGGVDMAFMVKLENGSIKKLYSYISWRKGASYTAGTR